MQGGAGASRKQRSRLCVSKQLGVPGEPRWKVTLLRVDLGHGLTKFSGPTFGLGVERKALHVFNHFACEAKA